MSLRLNSPGKHRYRYRVESWHQHKKIVHLVGAAKKVLDVLTASEQGF